MRVGDGTRLGVNVCEAGTVGREVRVAVSAAVGRGVIVEVGPEPSKDRAVALGEAVADGVAVRADVAVVA